MGLSGINAANALYYSVPSALASTLNARLIAAPEAPLYLRNARLVIGALSVPLTDRVLSAKDLISGTLAWSSSPDSLTHLGYLSDAKLDTKSTRICGGKTMIGARATVIIGPALMDTPKPVIEGAEFYVLDLGELVETYGEHNRIKTMSQCSYIF
jgi:hypothetical protein